MNVHKKNILESLQVLHNNLFSFRKLLSLHTLTAKVPVNSDARTRGWKKEVTKERRELGTVSCSDTEFERIMDTPFPVSGP